MLKFQCYDSEGKVQSNCNHASNHSYPCLRKIIQIRKDIMGRQHKVLCPKIKKKLEDERWSVFNAFLNGLVRQNSKWMLEKVTNMLLI